MVDRARRRLALAALTAVLALVTPALGQAGGGAFPDPITTSQMARFADQLGLSAEQRADLAPFFDEYRRQMKALRDGPMEEYLAAAGGATFTSVDRPREEVEANVRRRRQILDQAARHERELLDRLESMLTPEQAADMARVRLAAERERLRALLGPFFRAGLEVEIAPLVAALELDEAATAATAPIVADHERRVTRALRELVELRVREPLDFADAVAASGLQRPMLPAEGQAPDQQAPDQQAPDQQAREQQLGNWFRAVHGVRTAVTAPQQAKRTEIMAMHRAAIDRLREVLLPQQGHRLFQRFAAKAYPEARDPLAVDQRFADAIELGAEGKLSDEAVAGLVAARDAYAQRVDAITREMMDEIDSAPRGLGIIFFEDDGKSDAEARAARMAELQRRRAAVSQEAEDQIRALLGEQLSERVLAKERPSDERRGMLLVDGFEGAVIEEANVVVADGGGTVTVMTTTFEMGPGGPGAQGALPAPLAAGELDAMMEQLAQAGAGEAARPVVEVLHDEYVQAYRQARDEEQGAIDGDAEGAIMGIRPNGAPMTVAEVERRHAAYRRALERLEQLDAAFFENVRALYDGTPVAAAVDHAKARRERSVLRSASGPGGAMPMVMLGGGGGREAEMDLAELALSAGLDQEALAAVQPLLRSYEAQVTGLLRKRRDVTLEGRRESELLRARATKVGEDGRIEVRLGDDVEGFGEMMETQQRVAAADAEVAALNRSLRDQLLATLPEPAREMFRRAYNRQAWPSVFRDAQAAAPKLEAALALSDLTDDQRGRLTALAEEHRIAYDALCEQMVEVEATAAAAGAGAAGPPDPMRIQTLQARQNAMKKLRFDRTERNAQTLQVLAAILTGPQIERIGGLELPEPKERFSIGFGP